MLILLSNEHETVVLVLNAANGLTTRISRIPQKFIHVQALQQGRNEACGYLLFGDHSADEGYVNVHLFPEHAALPTSQMTTIWLADNQSGMALRLQNKFVHGLKYVV